MGRTRALPADRFRRKVPATTGRTIGCRISDPRHSGRGNYPVSELGRGLDKHVRLRPAHDCARTRRGESHTGDLRQQHCGVSAVLLHAGSCPDQKRRCATHCDLVFNEQAGKKKSVVDHFHVFRVGLHSRPRALVGDVYHDFSANPAEHI